MKVLTIALKDDQVVRLRTLADNDGLSTEESLNRRVGGFDTQFDFLDVSPYTIDVSPMISTPTPNYVSKPRVGEILAHPDGPFENAAKYVRTKNAELYRRLA